MVNRRKKSEGQPAAARQAQSNPDAKTSGSRKSSSVGAEKGGSASAALGYEVGYGKPPRHTQFQKGQPRPPRKPKPEREEGFDDWFEEELRIPMKFIDENGDEQVFPKGKVLAKASVNKALKSGDIRQIKDFIPRRPEKKDDAISATDLEAIARFLANYRGGALMQVLGRAGDGTSGGADFGSTSGAAPNHTGIDDVDGHDGREDDR